MDDGSVAPPAAHPVRVKRVSQTQERRNPLEPCRITSNVPKSDS